MKKVAKRCARCGRIARVPARQEKCYQLRFGKGSYSCWGDLEAVPGDAPAAADAPGRRPPQDVAAEKAERARKKVDAYVAALKRTTLLLAKWQRVEREQRRLAARTDAQVEAERQKRKARAEARPRRRAIAMRGEIG